MMIMVVVVTMLFAALQMGVKTRATNMRNQFIPQRHQ